MIQRQEREGVEGVFCEMIDSRHAFWFSPSLVERNVDGAVVSWEPPEDAHLISFRRSEVERLHGALQPDGRSIAVLPSQFQRIPGFRTQPSQVRVKAVLLQEDAPQEDRDRIEIEVENLLGRGVTDPSVWKFTRGLRRTGCVFTAAASLCRYLSRNDTDAAGMLARLHTEQSTEGLHDFNEYKLLAEFRCSDCDRTWKSGLGWGVYHSRLRPNCMCLTHPLPGREARTTAEHLGAKGCVHVFRATEDCDKVDVEEWTEEVLEEDQLGRLGMRIRHVRSELHPRDNAGPPRQGCEVCYRQCDAIYCQLVGKPLSRPHRARLCPKCIRVGGWCHGAIHKSDIVMRYALVASLLDPNVTFSVSEAGLEAEIQHEGYQVLLLLRPWLFVVPEHRQAYTTTGQEAAVLRPDRQPAGADEQRMFRRALSMVMSDRVTIMTWPLLSLADTASALHAFAESGAITSPSDAVASSVRLALQQRDGQALQQALTAVQQAPGSDEDSRPSLADRFRAFLRLREMRTPSSGAPASSNQVPATAEPVNMPTAGRPDAANSFALASQRMGGKLVGPWRCFRVDDKQHYGQRHGQTYWKPHGWVKRRLFVPDYNGCKDWPIAYHGTNPENAAKILLSELRRPGIRGAVQAHGAAGAASQGTIYVSPSIYYAGHPVYAPLNELENSQEKWFQIVLQCKVRPSSFRLKGGTLGNKHWPRDVRMDPNFADLSTIEWLVDDEDDVVVIGLMYRELGRGVDASIYGRLVTQVTRNGHPDGPEYAWTKILAKDHRQRGLLVR